VEVHIIGNPASKLETGANCLGPIFKITENQHIKENESGNHWE
jgi:hypothetical protein